MNTSIRRVKVKYKKIFYIYSFIIFFALMEQQLLSIAGTTGEKIIFNKFSIYHIAFATTIYLFTLLVSESKANFFAYILLEDIFYHIFDLKWIQVDTWIANIFPIANITIGDYVIIPGAYFILILLYITTMLIERIKDGRH